MSLPDKLLLSVRETAWALNVSPRHVGNLVKAGKLRPVKIGRRTLFSPEDLRRFIEAQRKGASALEVSSSGEGG